MSFEYLYGLKLSREQRDLLYHELFLTRTQELARIRKHPLSDVLILGGGVCSLTLARLASFHGLRTIVLVPEDVGVSPLTPPFRCEFSFPSQSELTRERCEYLRTYVRVFHNTIRRHPLFLRWLKRSRFRTQHELSDVAVLNWQRYAIDLLLSARREGAIILSYAHLESFHSDDEGVLSIGFSDLRNGERHEVRSGIIFNLTGRQNVGRIQPAEIHTRERALLRFDSRVDPSSHQEAFCLSRGEERVALVNTDDGAVVSAVLDLPLDASDELIRDYIGHWTQSEGLSYFPIFSGVSDKTVSPAQIKKVISELWSQTGHILTLPAECLEYAEEVARGGLLKAFQIANQSLQLVSLEKRPLSGTLKEQAKRSLRERLEVTGLESDQALRLIRSYGRRAEEFLADPRLRENIAGGVLRGELIHAKRVELATTSEDLLTRRLLHLSLDESARQCLEETFKKIDED